MKFSLLSLLLLVPATAFTPMLPPTSPIAITGSALFSAPPLSKKLAKLELLKINSNSLTVPLIQDMADDKVFVSKDGMQILKYHGSYMQQNRDVKGKSYQFMLRLKQPAGLLPPDLFRLLDDLSAKHGQGDLRATTRQCFQVHGIMKGDMKTVISAIMNIGSSTVGACGDVSRNVMATPAPFVSKEYQHVREWSKVFGHLFRPMTPAFSEIWLDGEKAATMEVWGSEVGEKFDIDNMMRQDTGRGVVLPDSTEPIYGDRYLPRKVSRVPTTRAPHVQARYSRARHVCCLKIAAQNALSPSKHAAPLFAQLLVHLLISSGPEVHAIGVLPYVRLTLNPSSSRLA